MLKRGAFDTETEGSGRILTEWLFIGFPGFPRLIVPEIGIHKIFHHSLVSGERNTVELVCFADECIHIVNEGKVVMHLHAPRRIDGPNPLPVTSDPFILQSKEAEILYRQIESKPITSLPPEFAR